jgi:hypothetical protein
VQGDVILESRDKDDHLIGEKSVSFDGKAEWEGNSFAAAVVTGEIAAGTLPGRRSARQALEDLLRREPGEYRGGVVPNIVPVS